MSVRNGSSDGGDHRGLRIEPNAVQSVPGYQAIVDHLRREIALGRVIPGDRLPSERRLAERYGVARETLRQALRVLEGSGQVVIQRGATGGATVRALPVDADAALEELRRTSIDVFDLIEFRAIIEPAAARLAARARDDDQLVAMEQAQEALTHAQTHDEFRRADTQFHLAVAEASRNVSLRRAIEDARSRMFRPTGVIPYDFVKESSHSAHQTILDAIRTRDGSTAESAMVDHITVTKEEFTRALTRQSPVT